MDIHTDDVVVVQAAGLNTFTEYCVFCKDMPKLIKLLKPERYWRSVTASGRTLQHTTRELSTAVANGYGTAGLEILTVLVRPDGEIGMIGAKTVEEAYSKLGALIASMSSWREPNSAGVVRITDILQKIPKSVEVDL